MKLRSKRVYLRRLEVEDRDELIRLHRSSVRHLRGYARSTFTRDDFDQMLADSETDANERLLVCRVEDEAVVGTLSLSQIFRKSFQNAYLGYQLFAGSTGNGYMTEAVALALRFSFIDLRLHRIEANVQPQNKPSIGVLVRNGFVKEGFSRRYLKIGGQWRDHERWAILKEDWIANVANGRNGATN